MGPIVPRALRPRADSTARATVQAHVVATFPVPCVRRRHARLADQITRQPRRATVLDPASRVRQSRASTTHATPRREPAGPLARPPAIARRLLTVPGRRARPRRRPGRYAEACRNAPVGSAAGGAVTRARRACAHSPRRRTWYEMPDSIRISPGGTSSPVRGLLPGLQMTRLDVRSRAQRRSQPRPPRGVPVGR
jgi:hypothetical protein